MRVSIVIACYSYIEHLIEYFRNILAQTFENLEAIAIDDASTEGEVSAIERRFLNQRIRLTCHEQNRGLVSSSNASV